MNATKKILALAVVALLSLAGTASAHHGTSSATVYGAKLAAPSTTTTTRTDDETAVSGKALLVDGTKNNVLVVHVRNLKPNTAYTFDVAGAPDFAATTATTNADGKLKGFVKSATFNAVAGTTYTVEVKEGDTVVASGDLQALPIKRHFGHRGHKRHRHHHGAFKKFDRHGEKAAQSQSRDSGHNCDKGDQGEQAQKS
jgi:hypothetical protein